jgi:hypothetical protein
VRPPPPWIRPWSLYVNVSIFVRYLRFIYYYIRKTDIFAQS